MKQKIFQTGNSAVVVIPASFLKNLGIRVGDEVLVETDEKNQTITLSFPHPRQLPLMVKEQRVSKKRKASKGAKQKTPTK